LLDAASTLYSVAATTDKIRSGNSILDIVTRTPVIFAKTLSSIDIPSS
jgi:alkanesulfonate monooxygenase SsuD/methylene tetrahydromethanopterin reductase-like flavin-dependent oxidoreductase (luciferase family)